MSIITKSRLTALTEPRTNNRTFSQTLSEVKSSTRTGVTTSIFLSHSHADLQDGTVDKAIVFLRNIGISIYIDSRDTSMPPLTNAVTADKIKREIAANKKFILLATNNAIASRWCNWELGFGDAKKYSDHIALLPLSDNSETWRGNEYLGVYPRIEEIGNYPTEYRVLFPNSTSMSLSDWLKR